MHARLAALVLGAAGLLVGCILDLTPTAACGDGVVDDDLGEECDPSAEDSPPCTAECRSILAYCGNGKLDPGEQCDLSDFGNKNCPSGKGYLSCTPACELSEATCDPCGNGVVDDGEECDPRVDDVLQPKNCNEISPYPLKPYTSGRATQCTDKCFWYRGPCGYCGDDEVDGPTLVDLDYPDQTSKPEFCDGADADIADLRGFCDDNCPMSGLECTPRCLQDCSAFDISQISTDELQCCLPTNDDCPLPGAPAPCCAAYDMRLDDLFADEACKDRAVVIDDQLVLKKVCR
jgi:hypothetical protein